MTLHTRNLRTADLGEAVELVIAAIPEIPLYTWALGDSADDPGVIDWLARALLRGHLANGTAVGAFADDSLVGVVTWAAAERATPPVDADAAAHDVAVLKAHLDMAKRLALTMQMERESLMHPDPEAVHVEIAAVRADHRQRGALMALMLPIQTMCRDENRRFTCVTGSATLRRVFAASLNMTEYRTTAIGDVPLYCLTSAVPPVVRPRNR
ncbi:hypothetical protein [Gordonia phthalatica]|uniref:N-acetyltransferase domain-containing protein n=1 Tax=Gordonia phthalatica TaxID=1136941 RepID=A0A0N9NJC9_9ACTN|nr:hypothetical protein [Gordonia phthalatica]ALG85725.1 hypothetical protein ACH46_16105 [Gordonia phthalatica]